MQKNLDDRLLESVGEEAARMIKDQDYIGLHYSTPFLSSGRTFYEALQDLDDQQLDEVYTSLTQL